MKGIGFTDRYISGEDIGQIVIEGLAEARLDGKRVLAIIPDSTRTMPMPLLFRLITDELLGRAKAIDFLVALGTHRPMSEQALNKHVGITAAERMGKFAGVKIINHAWDDPSALCSVGTIPASWVRENTDGLMNEDVPVAINKVIFDYDVLLICGPVFPHEVVGFSGGNKYLFPGIAGPDIIHFFHWLGAVNTNSVIIGTKETPTRRVVEKAAEMVAMPTVCITLVTKHDSACAGGVGVHGVFCGDPIEAWSRAVDIAAVTHIKYLDRPYKKVLGIAPKMYDDLWTAGKVMYKLEPILDDGAELVIYAPHISEVSFTHGAMIDRIGYHTRDYFLKQMPKFTGVPGGIMAHSTHVKGIGTFIDGIESARCNVILATGIPKERCDRINLGWRDWREIRITEWENREHDGILCVHNAGETLYRLAGGTVPRIR